MLLVQVFVRVKPEFVEAFKMATVENARASLGEPGIAQFDLLQSNEDPCRFTLLEGYRRTEATAAHKETPHYLKWRDAVAPMMAEPRSSVRYSKIFPVA